MNECGNSVRKQKIYWEVTGIVPVLGGEALVWLVDAESVGRVECVGDRTQQNVRVVPRANRVRSMSNPGRCARASNNSRRLPGVPGGGSAARGGWQRPLGLPPFEPQFELPQFHRAPPEPSLDPPPFPLPGELLPLGSRWRPLPPFFQSEDWTAMHARAVAATRRSNTAQEFLCPGRHWARWHSCEQ